jgi:hypothetical protein
MCQVLWVALLGVGGCAGNVTAGESTVAITNLKQLDTVEPGSDSLMSFPIEFRVENFTLRDKCGTKSNCGHVVLLVDLNGCKTFGDPYNDMGSTSPIDAHFSRCPTGSHSVQLQLHHDDDSPELNQNGDPIASENIVIVLGIPDGGP